ncbi:MAG: hypothetical protein ACRCZ9_08250 [Fusobacteriaceae bacterium]
MKPITALNYLLFSLGESLETISENVKTSITSVAVDAKTIDIIKITPKEYIVRDEKMIPAMNAFFEVEFEMLLENGTHVVEIEKLDGCTRFKIVEVEILIESKLVSPAASPVSESVNNNNTQHHNIAIYNNTQSSDGLEEYEDDMEGILDDGYYTDVPAKSMTFDDLPDGEGLFPPIGQTRKVNNAPPIWNGPNAANLIDPTTPMAPSPLPSTPNTAPNVYAPMAPSPLPSTPNTAPSCEPPIWNEYVENADDGPGISGQYVEDILSMQEQLLNHGARMNVKQNNNDFYNFGNVPTASSEVSIPQNSGYMNHLHFKD